MNPEEEFREILNAEIEKVRDDGVVSDETRSIFKRRHTLLNKKNIATLSTADLLATAAFSVLKEDGPAELPPLPKNEDEAMIHHIERLDMPENKEMITPTLKALKTSLRSSRDRLNEHHMASTRFWSRENMIFMAVQTPMYFTLLFYRFFKSLFDTLFTHRMPDNKAAVKLIFNSTLVLLVQQSKTKPGAYEINVEKTRLVVVQHGKRWNFENFRMVD